MRSQNGFFGVFFYRNTREAISMGGDFGLGAAASCSARLPLPNPSITDLDQAVELAFNHMSLADLRLFVKTLDHARHTVKPHG